MKTSSLGRVYTLTLPTGARVKARRPSVLSIISTGGFPAELTVSVFKLLNKQLDPASLVTDPEELKKFSDLIERFLPYVLVDPKIGDTTNLQEDESGYATGVVALMDITDMDKQFIFLFGNGVYRGDEEIEEGKGVVVSDLQPFRGEPTGVDDRPGGEPIQAAPVGADRPAAGEPVGA